MLKIGTSGFRGIDKEEINEKTCRRIALATANIIKRCNLKEEIFVGFDHRENSQRYAIEMCKVLHKCGIDCHYLGQEVTSGFVSYLCRKNDLDLSIIVTASHNPYTYNGVKIFSKYGQDLSSDLECQYNDEMSKVEDIGVDGIDIVPFTEQDKLEDEYIAEICKNLTKMTSNIKVAYDTMHGSSGRLAQKLIDRLKIDGMVIDSMDISGRLFDAPIPSRENTYLHKDIIEKNGLDFSFATDGDGDRLAVVTRDGVYHDASDISPFLYYFAIKEKGEKGGFVGNYSFPILGKMVCDKLGTTYIESKIGFKHIGKKMIENGALMGSENSSLSYAPVSYFKDGLVAFALLCEAVSFYKKPLEDLLKDFKQNMDYNLNYLEKSYHFKLLKNGEIANVLGDLDMPHFYPILSGEGSVKTDSLDGYKYFFPSGTLLIRQSGTEALIRFVIESKGSPEDALKEILKQFLEYAKDKIIFVD